MSDSPNLHAEIDLGPPSHARLPGAVLDFAESSARVSVREHVAGGSRVGLRLHRPSTGVAKEVPAYVVWHRAQEDGETHLGLKFAPLEPGDLHDLLASCVWSVRRDGGRALVAVRGDLGESIDLEPLRAAVGDAGTVELDMSQLRRVNSVGAVRWIDFVHALRPRAVHFVRCSLDFTSHAAMSTGMIGHGVVDSVMAPYLCASCGASEVCLVDMVPLRGADKIRPPRQRCSACGGVLEFDDIPERYFSFLD